MSEEDKPAPVPAAPKPFRTEPFKIRGKSVSMAAYIRAKTKSGRVITDFMLHVMQGGIANARTADRIKAGEWLADRAYGKAVERSVMVKLESDLGNQSALAGVSVHTTKELLRQLAELKSLAAGEIVDVEPSEPTDANAGEPTDLTPPVPDT